MDRRTGLPLAVQLTLQLAASNSVCQCLVSGTVARSFNESGISMSVGLAALPCGSRFPVLILLRGEYSEAA